VAAAEFFFAIDLSDDERSLEMFREVVSRLLSQAGLGAREAAAALTELENAVVPVPGAKNRRVTLEARSGRLDISVTSPAGRLWQVTHSLA
jgi:hypothetical protein